MLLTWTLLFLHLVSPLQPLITEQEVEEGAGAAGRPAWIHQTVVSGYIGEHKKKEGLPPGRPRRERGAARHRTARLAPLGAQD